MFRWLISALNSHSEIAALEIFMNLLIDYVVTKYLRKFSVKFFMLYSILSAVELNWKLAELMSARFKRFSVGDL